MSEGIGRSGASPQAPYVVSFLICDHVHIDPATGKKTILGVFSAIRAEQFPAIIPQMCIYVAFSDGRGKIPCKVRLIDVDEEREPVFEAEGEVDSPDPRTVVELIMTMGNVNFPSAGEYRMQFFACGEFLMERRIVILDHLGN